MEPDAVGGSLTPKESVLFLQRLAMMHHHGGADNLPPGVWDELFLGMVHTLCTSSVGPQVSFLG